MNALDTLSFNQNTPNAFYQNVYGLNFTPTEIDEIGGPGGAQLVGPAGPSYASNGVAIGDFGTDFQIATTKTTQNEQTPVELVFATAVSAAPEPSTWLLMFAGIGGIGLMLRRAKRTVGYQFKDAFNA